MHQRASTVPGTHTKVRKHFTVEQANAALPLVRAIVRDLAELSRDKETVAFCDISLRGYEAALILDAAGFGDVRVMDGGGAM